MSPSHTSSPYKLVVIANDFQIPFHDKKALKLFLLFLEEEQPDWLILNGDFMDFWEISKFDLNPKAGKAFLKEIKMGRRILEEFRQLLPKAHITWLEGNHEFRLRQYLISHAKELYGLPGLSVQELFRLDEVTIEYLPCRASLSRFSDNYLKVGDLYVGHWDKVAKHGGYAAKALVEEKGVSILQGHTQRFGAHARTTVDGRVLLGIENSSMCSMQPTYVTHPNWQLGFSVLYHHVRSGVVQWYPILIRDSAFVWAGKEYDLKGVRQIRRKRRA